MLVLLVYLQQEKIKMAKKLIKIVNIDEGHLHIFRAT